MKSQTARMLKAASGPEAQAGSQWTSGVGHWVAGRKSRAVPQRFTKLEPDVSPAPFGDEVKPPSPGVQKGGATLCKGCPAAPQA